jgi:archaemetzincin
MKKLLILLIAFILGSFLWVTAHFINSIDKESLTPTIHLQPFNGMDPETELYVFKELKKMYPYVTLNKPVSLPSSSYYSLRKRYRADSLIAYLSSKTPANHVSLGMTSSDISTTTKTNRDWGVMGLAYRPGKSGITSTHRVKNKDQYLKVVIHELGHTQGLPHCPVATCYMRDARGKNPLDHERKFCNNCKKHLIERGWKFDY